ncbi:RNA-binding protein ARP1 [Hirschfeldia incana]|nr:RNA-binding protein ARP1 [Hirschfeldia incana]
MTTSDNVTGCFGDTKLTKVFVGGLAWDTQKEAMHDHFIKYGDILEAVIISDKLTRRSKGYGFVTFKDAEAAVRACEDSTPIINGRRANCNLASLGVRHRRPPTMPSPQQGSKKVSRATSGHVGNNQSQWYYPAGFTHQQQHHHQAVPFYGYPSSYVAPNMTFNQKVGYVGGTYMNGYYAQPQHLPQPQYYHQNHMYGGGRVMVAASPTIMPLYTVYPYHQSPAISFPQPSFTKHIPTHPISGTVGGGDSIMKKA